MHVRWLVLSVSTLGLVGCAGDAGGSAFHGEPRSGGYDGEGRSRADAGVSAAADGGRAAPEAERSADGGLVADGSTDAEPHEPPGTNPFVRTQHDPFSTFAADVDTASYDIFVRDVGYGSLPAPHSVRLEEFVNYFDYDYPAPEAGAAEPFAIDLAASPHPMGRELAQLRVGIQAEEAPAFRKVPTNLVFLVDVSGSMQSADKLPLVQTLLVEALDVLEATDTVSVVTYASGTGVRLAPTPASDRGTIEGVIQGLEAGGSTNGGRGIQLAYQQAEDAFRPGGFNHVVLCTDGDFNVGVTNTDALVDLIEEKRESGITLTALGFGRSNNDAMMERVSNAGNGIYSVIASEDHAVRYAHDRLLHTITHVAQDMKIQVEFNPEHVLAYRLLGYENRAIADQDFRNDTVDAGEVGAGHRVTALYEVVLDGQAIPEAEDAPSVDEGEPVEGEREVAADELVRVKVRYKEVGASASDPAREVSESLLPEEVEASALDDDFLWAAAVAAFAEILKDSPYADEADLDLIDTVAHAQSGRDADRGEFATLFDTARSLLTAR